MLCKICSHESQKIFTAQILKKYDVDYFACATCGFVQTEEPYWLAEAYRNPISMTDTGVLSRNISLSKITAVLAYFLYKNNGKFLDFAGGYGIFTRLMRDYGFDYYWQDIYTQNIFAKGFEYDSRLDSLPRSFDELRINCALREGWELVSSFECFEHLPSPLTEIEQMLAIAPAILFTTDLLPSPVPAPDAWWYYAQEQGQHISFYCLKTLEYIAQKYGLNFYSHWGIHLLSKKEISNLFFKKLIEYHKVLFNHVVLKGMKGKAIGDRQVLQKLP